MQQFFFGDRDFDDHIPAGFAEKVGHDGHAQKMLRAGGRGQHDALYVATQLRTVLVFKAQAVRDLVHAHQATSDFGEVAQVLIPHLAQLPRSRGDQIQENPVGGDALVEQLIDELGGLAGLTGFA